MSLVEIDLGRNHNILPLNSKGLERTSKIFFACAVGVFVCSVKEIDAKVQGVGQHHLCLLRIKGPGLEIIERYAKRHTSYAYAGDLDSSIPQFCVFHILLL